MNYVNKSPAEAKQLLDSNEGWIYVDVRTVDEFQMGHPRGAWNVPFAVRGAMGVAANPDFAGVMNRAFSKESKLIIGCATGGRSSRACELLAKAGYEQVVNVLGGFQGSEDNKGKPVPGWRSSGLPVDTNSSPERSYAALRAQR
jgi:rhodanese-related sulfurtransferase